VKKFENNFYELSGCKINCDYTYKDIIYINTKLKQSMISGIAGTSVMTAIMFVAPMMGIPKMNSADMLAGMMGVPVIVGWMMHFMIGVVFAASYVYIFHPKVNIGSKALKGAIFGFAVFVFAQITMAMMGGMPKPEGSMMLMMIGSIMGHVVFGIAVSLLVKESKQILMTLIHHNVKKLHEINGLLQQLPSDLYVLPKEVLSEATIGQHFRHILEFYICLEKGTETGVICYDDRERHVLIETDADYAENTIKKLIHFLGTVKDDRSLTMKADYSTKTEDQITIPTSLYRELAYALDHAVHHLAIVKIALVEEKDVVKVDSNLGVAPSTVRYREECVQ